MSRSLRARWTNGLVLLGLAVLMAWVARGDGVFWSLVVPLAYAGAGLWASPVGDRTTLSQAQVEALPVDQRRVVVYARPGCSWCLRLRVALLGRRPAPTWVDIWDDEAAAAHVRSVNHGDETVPTVVIDGDPVTNPPPSVVRAALHANVATT